MEWNLRRLKLLFDLALEPGQKTLRSFGSVSSFFGTGAGSLERLTYDAVAGETHIAQ
jgi:hypothetical protein